MTLILNNNKERCFTHKENKRIKMSLNEVKEGNAIHRNLTVKYKSVSTTVALGTSLESCLSRPERQSTDYVCVPAELENSL